jgi:GGDEF domain-containing protein
MSSDSRRVDGAAGQREFVLTIRARLLVLALIAILPLLFARVWSIQADRSERIEAASRQALILARQGMAAQNEALVSARAFMQVGASAHALMAARGERCDDFLANAIQQAAWLKSLSLVAPSGRIVCSSNADIVGLDISSQPHFKSAMVTGKFALGDYFVGSKVGPTLIAALPHHATDGSIDVVVSAALDLGWFDRAMSIFAQSSGSVVVMFDGAGTVLARQPSEQAWVGRQFKDHLMIRTMSAQPEGIFAGECLDGIRRIFGYVQLPGTNARLAVGVDESDVLRRVQEEIIASLAGLALLIAIVLIGIWFGGEKLFVQPIRSLTRMTQRLGHGEFGSRATQLPWAGEFIPLAAALDDMAGQIASREQQLRESNSQLRQLAYADALTGIANRRAFNGQLATKWRLAAEFAWPIAVLIIDVDHFKLFNDHYGHVDGDLCLKQISEVLIAGTRTRSEGAMLAMPPSFRKSVARACDFTARYGGEDFAVLLQRSDPETARRVAERLRLAVEKLGIAHAASPLGYVTISVGATSTVPAAGDNAQELVERADVALYEAKRRGRNVVIAHSALMLAKAS